jgi:hypothetical protein
MWSTIGPMAVHGISGAEPASSATEYSSGYKSRRPITAAARSEVRSVFALSNAGIVGSTPVTDACVCVYSVFVLP